MLLRYVILGLLRDEEMHGYRIKAEFEERTGHVWPIHFGQIYGMLRELKRRQLIAGRLESNGSHMGRWVYRATAKGRRALATWVARKPSAPVPERNEILVRLMAKLDDPEACGGLVERQSSVYQAYLAELQAQRHALDAQSGEGSSDALLARLAIDATIGQIDAHVRWLAHCARMLVERRAPPAAASDETASAARPARRPPRRVETASLAPSARSA